MAVSVNEVLTLSLKGRASRTAYWLGLAIFIGLSVIPLALLSLFPMGIEASSAEGFLSGLNTIVSGLWLLLSLAFLLSCVVRRLHDISYSGAAAAFLLIPGVQLIVLMVLGCVRGKRGLNRFGPDPLAIMTIGSAAPYYRERPRANVQGSVADGAPVMAGQIFAEVRQALNHAETPAEKTAYKLAAIERLEALAQTGCLSERDCRLWRRRIEALP